MARLANISGRKAAKIFAKIGYYLNHQEGSHLILYSEKPGALPLSIPAHKELAPGLLRPKLKEQD